MNGNNSESDKIQARAATLPLVHEMAFPTSEPNPGEQLVEDRVRV